MKTILKTLGLTQYYEHATHIISTLSGQPPPTINREIEERLRLMFRQIQIPFEKHCPTNRVNFLSYSYVLHKFCQLLEIDDFTKCFPLLKSREKLRQQDKIWEKICVELRWQYIPSV
ncbi:Poxvirus Late Transcription Factor VLTF3 like [uncultured virus]|nr:Poxvirus Late Transcription Factor VLTF3 like [uncultured virus]